jgi:hypothetical protein
MLGLNLGLPDDTGKDDGSAGANTGDLYFRPGGVDRYLRPNGTSLYLRP